MLEKHPLCPERVRKISGSFAFIEHRFLREGFWATLSPKELALYVFFILVAGSVKRPTGGFVHQSPMYHTRIFSESFRLLCYDTASRFHMIRRSREGGTRR